MGFSAAGQGERLRPFNQSSVMSDLSDFGIEVNTDTDTAGDRPVPYNRHDCRAITGGGTQCENSPTTDDLLCTVHEDSYRIRRVDEFDAAPTRGLREALQTECDIGGRRAYALATLAEDIEELWARLTDPEEAPLEVGDNTRSFGSMVNVVSEIAVHPTLNVDGELFAQQDCVAQTNSADRCSYSGNGVLRLCRIHRDVDDLIIVEEFRSAVARLRTDDRYPTKL